MSVSYVYSSKHYYIFQKSVKWIIGKLKTFFFADSNTSQLFCDRFKQNYFINARQVDRNVQLKNLCYQHFPSIGSDIGIHDKLIEEFVYQLLFSAIRN